MIKHVQNVIRYINPCRKKHKFIKIASHLQGFDQLKYDKDYLIICSSLKDAMCLKII